MKKYSDAVAYGIGFGMLFYVLQLLFLKVEAQTSSQILVVVIGSAVMGLSSLIYQKENWSLLTQGVLHFLGVFAIVNVMAYLNGWFAFNLSFYLGFVLQFVVIYAIIWLVIYYLQGQKVKQINAHLGKKD